MSLTQEQRDELLVENNDLLQAIYKGLFKTESPFKRTTTGSDPTTPVVDPHREAFDTFYGPKRSPKGRRNWPLQKDAEYETNWARFDKLLPENWNHVNPDNGNNLADYIAAIRNEFPQLDTRHVVVQLAQEAWVLFPYIPQLNGRSEEDAPPNPKEYRVAQWLSQPMRNFVKQVTDDINEG